MKRYLHLLAILGIILIYSLNCSFVNTEKTLLYKDNINELISKTDPTINQSPLENIEEQSNETTLKQESVVKNITSSEKEKSNLQSDQKKLSEIIVANNKYTSSEFLKKRLKIKSGEYINEKKLQQHLNFLNLNPFRKVEMILENVEENTYDIELICHDRFYLRPYIGVDNTGLQDLNRNRLYTGLNWNRAFAIDSILSYQYLTSFNFKKFQAHTGHWIVYLPWENFLTLFANYARIDVDHELPSITKHHGMALQTSIRYNICLPILDMIMHDLILGFDFKRTDTNLIFSRFSASDDVFVNLTQFLLAYGLKWNNNFYNTKFLFELYFSPGQMVCDEEDSKYNDLRRFAKNKYIFAKGYFANLIKIPKDFLLSLILSGQLASENLLPSETLILTGYNSVRGYYESQVNTDSGFILNFELRSPSFSFFRKNNTRDSLRLIAFFDYGYGAIHSPLPLGENDYHVFGYGPGLRYNINPYLTAKLDLGIKGKTISDRDENEDYVWHFSVNLSY